MLKLFDYLLSDLGLVTLLLLSFLIFIVQVKIMMLQRVGLKSTLANTPKL